MPPRPDPVVPPVSAVLSAWLGACLRGEVGPDDLLDAVRADERLHRVVGLTPDPLSLVLAVGGLRGRGGRTATLALPVPGDPTGLAGPSGFNSVALDAGEAVLVPGSGLGLVPERSEEAVTWRVLPAESARPDDPIDAGQHLRRTLAETAHLLERLDLARWQPDVAAAWTETWGDALREVRRGPGLALPASYPSRVRAVADQAVSCLAVVALADRAAPGILTAADDETGRRALAPLERAARRALVAACSL